MYLHIVRAYFEKPPFFAPKQTPMALGQWLIGLKGVPIARANPYGLLASSEAMAVAITGSSGPPREKPGATQIGSSEFRLRAYRPPAPGPCRQLWSHWRSHVCAPGNTATKWSSMLDKKPILLPQRQSRKERCAECMHRAAPLAAVAADQRTKPLAITHFTSRRSTSQPESGRKNE